MSDNSSKASLHSLEQGKEQKRLTREQFLQTRISEQTVFIDSMGGEIVMRSLSVKARRELRLKASPEGVYDDDLFTRLVIVHSIIDPPISDVDLAQLEEQDGRVFDEVVLKITMLNSFGVGEEDLKG